MTRESWRALYALLVKADPSRFVKQGTLAIVSGTRSYDLDLVAVNTTTPADVWRVVGVAVQDSSCTEGWRVLERCQWDERYDDSINTDYRAARYELRGNYIWIMPSPTWSVTVRVEYIPLAGWTSKSIASAPTTASTQATGTGNTVWRVNVAAATVAVGAATIAIAAAADFVIHTGSLLVANGQSCRATIVAKNVSGIITEVAVKGAAATTGTELAPTDAEIQTAVGAGNPWWRLADCILNRTGDVTVTQAQDAVDHIDAVNGIDEWLICDVCAAIKAIDEEDASYFMAQRETVQRRLLSDGVVDAGKPKQVTLGGRRRRVY
jgi:hypothetical protein